MTNCTELAVCQKKDVKCSSIADTTCTGSGFFNDSKFIKKKLLSTPVTSEVVFLLITFEKAGLQKSHV